jgi:hypothetical protein
VNQQTGAHLWQRHRDFPFYELLVLLARLDGIQSFTSFFSWFFLARSASCIPSSCSLTQGCIRRETSTVYSALYHRARGSCRSPFARFLVLLAWPETEPVEDSLVDES